MTFCSLKYIFHTIKELFEQFSNNAIAQSTGI